MRQFDLCINIDPATPELIPFLVVLQSDFLTPLATVIVTPVHRDGASIFLNRINPKFECDGKTYHEAV